MQCDCLLGELHIWVYEIVFNIQRYHARITLGSFIWLQNVETISISMLNMYTELQTNVFWYNRICLLIFAYMDIYLKYKKLIEKRMKTTTVNDTSIKLHVVK